MTTEMFPNPQLMLSIFHALLVERKRIVIKKAWLDRFKGQVNEVDVKVEMDASGDLIITMKDFRQTPQAS
jgi:hypothetical protein